MPKQHKSAQGHSFYFVLYLVAIVTVFVITNERDMLLAKRADDMARLGNILHGLFSGQARAALADRILKLAEGKKKS